MHERAGGLSCIGTARGMQTGAGTCVLFASMLMFQTIQESVLGLSVALSISRVKGRSVIRRADEQQIS